MFRIQFRFIKGSENEPSDALSRMHMNIAKRSINILAVRVGQPAGRLVTDDLPPGDFENTADSDALDPALADAPDRTDFVRPPLAILPAWVDHLIREQQEDPVFKEVIGILRSAQDDK
jgi:hypothetical protein